MADVEIPAASHTLAEDKARSEDKSSAEESRRPFLIGYSLSAKKAQSFLRQELIDACRQKNVLFVPIDRSKRLSQAPVQSYNAILHKDSSPAWTKQLEEYKSINPSCIIIDNPKNIVPLHNRVSMLECIDLPLLSSLHASLPSNNTLRVPRQISVTEGEDIHRALEEGSMTFPLVAKPLVADGSAESHKMYLVLNEVGLRKLTPPLVIQEFINHGGVIFKVYVVGTRATCTPRKSLPDCCANDLDDPEGLVFFSQISNLQLPQRHGLPLTAGVASPAAASDADAIPLLKSDVVLSAVPLPEDAFIQQLSALLRAKLELSLFNYDVIQDTKSGEYYIVDINYFPGFAKMPNYPSVLSDYFAGLADSGE